MTDKQKNENRKIAENLCYFISKSEKYKSEAEFCRDYIKQRKKLDSNFRARATDNTEKNFYDTFGRMKKGEANIQIEQLPYFTELLGVTCEDILCFDKPAKADRERITNYNTACSSYERVWEEYFNHKDALGAFYDEYGMTVVDYAVKLRNYGLIKFIFGKKDISPYKEIVESFQSTYLEFEMIRGASEYWNCSRRPLKIDDGNSKRKEIIYMAIKNNDVDMLESLDAKNECFFEHTIDSYGYILPVKENFYDHNILELIAETRSNKVINYFSQGSESKSRHMYIFPYISDVVEMLLSKGKMGMAVHTLNNIRDYNEILAQRVEFTLNNYLSNYERSCISNLNYEYLINLPKGEKPDPNYPDLDTLKSEMKNSLNRKNMKVKPVRDSSLVYEIDLFPGGHFRFVPVKINALSDDPIIKELVDDINNDYEWMFNYHNNISSVIDRYFENSKGEEDV